MNPVLDGIPGGLISLSPDLRIVGANRAMADLVHRPAEELIGRRLDVLLSAPSRILFQTHVYPALMAEGRVEEVFLTLAGIDGAATPVLFNAIRSDGDGPAAYDGLMVRIRARSRWEADMLAATQSLRRERAESQRLADDLAARYAAEQRSGALREAFIGVVSHELRTPITTIYGMSTLLRQRLGTLPQAVLADHLADIAAESDRLRRLTEDLLVLSRAEGGRLEVAENPVAVGQLVARTVESERLRATGHLYEVDAAPSLPLVLGEELYVEQVLRNYLSNAAKYSAPGTRIRVTAKDDDGVTVRVVDAGAGFGEQAPDRLFDLFYRSPDAIRGAAGAGIGLFVCRELVTAMRGRVWAAPDPRGGAEFGFWLPAAHEEEAAV
jgi:signal transduction histidine kinase